jgi:hypothetical protein
MICRASAARALSLGFAVYASAFGAACSQDGVLELFPDARANDCSGIGAAGASGLLSEAGDAEVCLALQAALAHRYSFNSLGATAQDSVASADGSIVNTMVATTGALELAGVESDQYVDLPNGLISGFKDASFEAWVNWDGGDIWQRIFDFGNTYEGEDVQGRGSTYLFLTPSHVYGSLWLAFSLAGPEQETVVDAGMQLPAGTTSHVVAVMDDTNDTMSLYLNGSLEGSVAFTEELAAVDDMNNWLGRSQFVIDDELGGTLYEFRIYRAALTEAEIATSYAAGPNPAFLGQ